MAIRTLYGFDEDGNKVAVGSYTQPPTVTVHAIDSNGNSLPDSILGGGGQYATGASCTISAPHAIPNYSFNKWTDSEGTTISTSKSYTFTVTEDVTYIAVFNIKE